MAGRTERTVPGPEDSDRPVWRVRQGSGNVFTFRELTTLQRWIVERTVQRDDEISADGERWKRLGNIAELASFFQVVDAADLARAPPLLTPMPMPPAPYYPTPARGIAPPPPSGFPPPSFAAAPVAIPAPPAPADPIPEHEVDLGPDLGAPPPRRRWPWVVVAVAAMAAGAGAAVLVPRFVTQPVPAAAAPPPPEPPAAPPPVVAAVAPEAPPSASRSTAPAPAAPQAEQPPEPRSPPAAPARPPTPKALIDRARKLLGSGSVEAALDLFGRVASEHPDNADALSGRGLCYLDLEKWAPAEESFRSALRVDPDQPEALLGLAETYRFQGKKAEAISQYERYLARHPDGEEVEVAKNALTELRK